MESYEKLITPKTMTAIVNNHQVNSNKVLLEQKRLMIMLNLQLVLRTNELLLLYMLQRDIRAYYDPKSDSLTMSLNGKKVYEIKDVKKTI